jgi:cis-3-alkyl-4-acyloxetan-2-one decarboxylase
MNIPEDIYPFKGAYATIDGHRLHYLDEGKGDPVIMLHGNPTWSIYYRNLVSALRDAYRVIVPDHMGCGFSDKPDDTRYEYTLNRRVLDLEALLSRLGVDQNITLVVHDWGGMIGMGFAVRHPEQIRRIVLLNTAAFHLPKTKPFPWLLWMGRDTWVGALLIQRLNAFSRVATYICCKKKPMNRALRKAYVAPYADNSIATLRFVQDIPLRPGDKAYDRVSQVQQNLKLFRDTPILLCWGEKDFVFDRHFLKEWMRFFPQAEVHRFPACGHYVLEDAPDEIIHLVRNFLEKHPV